MSSLYKIIPFAIKHGSCGGSLVQFQEGQDLKNALPFSIGKVLVSSGMQPDDVRGNHAHYETEEIVVVLSGGCTFELEDGRGTRERVRLGVGEFGSQGVGEFGSRDVGECGSRDVGECGSLGVSECDTPLPNNPHTPIPITDLHTQPALLLYPHIWRTFHGFEPGTVLLIVANIKYDEADYIRDRTEFERISKDWKNLGGSALECGDSTPL